MAAIVACFRISKERVICNGTQFLKTKRLNFVFPKRLSRTSAQSFGIEKLHI